MFIPFIHRPLSRYLNALADSGPRARAAWRSRRRRPGSWPGPPSTQAAATIPRLLFLRARRAETEASGHERVRGHHRAVRGGAVRGGQRLEDLGWFVIDNLPIELIPKVAELRRRAGFGRRRGWRSSSASAPYQRRARGRRSTRCAPTGGRVRQLFLDASTDVLVRRYEGTRRRHPLLEPGEGVAEAIERERALLEPVKEDADVVVDTTTLNVHELRARITELFGDDHPDAGMRTRVMSFGYKHGLPLDVDLVLDCRFLPNPHWVDELRPLTGLHDRVRDYVLEPARGAVPSSTASTACSGSCCRPTCRRASRT